MRWSLRMAGGMWRIHAADSVEGVDSYGAFLVIASLIVTVQEVRSFFRKHPKVPECFDDRVLPFQWTRLEP